MLALMCLIFYKKIMLIAAILYIVSLLVKPKQIKNKPQLAVDDKQKILQAETFKVTFLFLMLLMPTYLLILPLLPLYLGYLMCCVLRALLHYITDTNTILYKHKPVNKHTWNRIIKLTQSNALSKTPLFGFDFVYMLCCSIKNYSALVFYIYILCKEKKPIKKKMFLNYGKAYLCLLVTGYPLWYLVFLKQASKDAVKTINNYNFYKKSIIIRAVVPVLAIKSSIISRFLIRFLEKNQMLNNVIIVLARGELLAYQQHT